MKGQKENKVEKKAVEGLQNQWCFDLVISEQKQQGHIFSRQIDFLVSSLAKCCQQFDENFQSFQFQFQNRLKDVFLKQ